MPEPAATLRVMGQEISGMAAQEESAAPLMAPGVPQVIMPQQSAPEPSAPEPVAQPAQPQVIMPEPVAAPVAQAQPAQPVQQMQPAQAAPYTQPVQLIAPEQSVQPMQNVQSAPNMQQPTGVQQPAAVSSAAQTQPAQPANQGKKDDPNSTQATLLISELRDNVVIMKDGSFRAVVACKSINFDLMSDVEREGVEYSYQNFLNSLEFTTQILIRSQRVDIGPYIERLSEIRRNNDNMLLGVLMDDYINFIDILSEEANIMDKSFFIVVPYYTSAEDERSLQQTKNFFKTFSRAKGPEVTRIDRVTYDKALGELTNRVDVVISGLFQIGINSVRLNTKELAELYYNFNNPDTAVREPLGDFSKLATMYVKKGEKDE